MDCDTARQALSARIDGEREPIPAVRVDEHLAGCDPCRQWQAAAVGQTQMLRRLAGRSQLSAVRPSTQLAPHPSWQSWPRWALGGVGLVQGALAIAQGLSAHPGAAHGGHALNESTAWAAALGLAMLVTALQPAAALGLAWVLGSFTAALLCYEISDALAGQVGVHGSLAHLPVLAGAVLALLVWRRHQAGGAGPHPTEAMATEEIVLPDSASRGRRRGHLRSTDGSAA